MWRKKNVKAEDLNISMVLTLREGLSIRPRDVTYKLTAVIFHQGSSINAGHYTGKLLLLFNLT